MSERPELDATSLDVETIQRTVDYIATVVDDPEVAHNTEDRLRGQVLTAIAIGRLRGADASRAAWTCLQTDYMDFERWCA